MDRMRNGRACFWLLAHTEITAFRLSKGGVPANNSSRFSIASSRPTKRQRMFGLSLSPLLISIQFVDHLHQLLFSPFDINLSFLEEVDLDFACLGRQAMIQLLTAHIVIELAS